MHPRLLPLLLLATTCMAADIDVEQVHQTQRALRIVAANQLQAPSTALELIEAIGTDPATIHAWVHQRTAWIPYQGSLRGAQGVLLDRHGNHCDRAVLLAEALRAAGHTVVLVQGEPATTRPEPTQGNAGEQPVAPPVSDATLTALAAELEISRE
ncbi:MAG: hypothetical protein PF961_00510, partial [Planctomycetota bacterium]|nr:hypothetical protein [Planctomycetota bacterium]